MDGYRISTDINEMDFDVIYQFISTSYWAQGIPKTTMRKAIENAFCFAIFDSDNNQIGFARLITDRATFAYLADVFIVETHRNKGLSKQLVSEIIDHPELQGLRRIMLATRDAHGLYQQFGFEAINAPEMLMQIHRPNVYKNG
ncbi:GNAT family N-acetyltransferase [Vibrio algarum]|uniref:GNAT family N-acetyltransferase n=1 Tax=Vibrio algarum TaxID=3020714 RepID=A0ABT4YVD8_9VIBR|nr:GNAT family N-acetyltransferase [Vibrio sp. KJ40-1]MDB1125521.1 GNAT family N-acetyltransferase [Vibrio sp. KJ40-1]